MTRFVAAAALAAVSTTAAASTVNVESYNGHDYAFVSMQADFDGAQQVCENLGMDLVTINSFAEQSVFTGAQVAHP